MKVYNRGTFPRWVAREVFLRKEYLISDLKICRNWPGKKVCVWRRHT